MSNESDKARVNIPVAADSITNERAKRILTYLKAGEEKINFKSNHDVVLILGNTGAGKTTFTQFIAGENDRMISTEVGEHIGEFIICDYDDKIGADYSIISKANFPELVIDTETKTAYVDNPGFNDSRNEAYDIATAYFIKKVFHKVKNVKIVLIVNYSSLRKGGSRNDFLSLLEHVTVLLKNIDKYTDSIALVATKVDNTFQMNDDIPLLIPDNVVINTIAIFLTEVKEYLNMVLNDGETHVSQSKHVESKTFCESAIKLLDVLLIKIDSRYTRLSIFRRPNGSGKVSEIKLLQDCKKIIKQMISQNLRYVPTKNVEIRYALSDKSKNVICDLITEISENIVVNMALVNTDLVTYYRNLELEMLSDDMYALRDRLASAAKALSSITNIDESVSATDLVDVMCKKFTDIGVHVRKSHLRNIANLNKFLVFLQDISAKEYKLFVRNWTKELDEAVRYVKNSLKWYNFLVILHDRLSEYDVQKNKSSYQVPTIPTLPAEGIYYVRDLDALIDFLNAIGDNNVYETAHYQEVKEIRLDDTKINFFYQLVYVILGETLRYTSFDEGQRVQVAGEYVLVSEVINNQLYNSCDSLQIFATHTVFLDEDLCKENDITIIAPRWEIVGQPTINLNGSAALPLPCIKAQSGSDEGSDGEDGIPGLPGTSAGHFLGIGSAFKHIENLSVKACGGPGGHGQNGGDGAPGENGEILDIQPNLSQCFKTYVQITEETIFKIPGGCGGDGGCGGIGGIGGHKGELITIDLSNGDAFANSLKISNKGNDGNPGISGQPGESGKSGTKISKANYEIQWWKSIDSIDSEVRLQTTQVEIPCFVSTESGSVGNPGKARKGISKKDRQSPKTKQFRRAPSLVISDYYNELFNSFNNCIKKHLHLRFYEEMQSNAQLHEYFDANILSRELQSLEVNHHLFTLDTTLILYHSIHKKILEVVRSQPKKRIQLENLRQLVYSRLLRLQAKPEIHEILSLDTPSIAKITIDKINEFFIFDVLDLVIENNIDPTTERIDAQIIELSYPHSEQVVDDLHELGALLLKRKLLGDLRVLSQTFNFLGMMLKLDSLILDQMSVSEISPSVKFQLTLPYEMRYEFENAMYKFQLNSIAALDALASLISTEYKLYQKSIEPKKNILRSLRAIEKKLQFDTRKTATFFSADMSVTDFTNSLEELGRLTKNVDTAVEMMKRIEVRRKLIEFDVLLYNKINRDSKVERVVEVLENVNDFAKKLDGLEPLIASVMRVIHTNISDPYDLDKISETKKTVLDFINSVIEFLHRMRQQFATNGELSSIIENLVEIAKVLRSYYGTAVVRELRMRLRKYSECQLNVKEDVRLYNDFTLYTYEHHFDVYKRLVFPYSILSENEFPVPSISEYYNNPDEDLLTSLEKKLEVLQTTLEKLQKNPPIEYTLEDDFNSTSNQGPLFEWKYTSYAKNITDLLQGKQVALTATVDPKENRQFLRFSAIRLRFHALDENMQVSLNEALRNFNIHMVHSGSSSFAFCDQIHLINEERTEYQHAVDTDAEAEQLKSPYTLWLFSLHPKLENITFRFLRPFVDQPINLLLEGHAKYLKIEDEAALREKFEIATMNADYSMLMQPASQMQ